MRMLAALCCLGVLISVCPQAQAGVVIGGTRFIYGEASPGIQVFVRNQSKASYLLNTKILPGGAWAGVNNHRKEVPFVATPPLFSLGAGRESSIRIIRVAGDLPSNQESLFTLSIASIPSGKEGSDTVQLAVRSGLKLFYRPKGLSGDPQNAYTQLKWSRAGNQVVVENPTPYYVTLFQLNGNGQAFNDAGMVAPFAHRTAPWCGKATACQLQWQSINDYGRVMPPVSLTLNGNTAVSVAVQAK